MSALGQKRTLLDRGTEALTQVAVEAADVAWRKTCVSSAQGLTATPKRLCWARSSEGPCYRISMLT